MIRMSLSSSDILDASTSVRPRHREIRNACFVVLLGLVINFHSLDSVKSYKIVPQSLIRLEASIPRPPAPPIKPKFKIKPSEVKVPPAPEEILSPVKLPPKESVVAKDSRLEGKEDWWDSSLLNSATGGERALLNAPAVVKQALAPKQRLVGFETSFDVQLPNGNIITVEGNVDTSTPADILNNIQKITKLSPDRHNLINRLNQEMDPSVPLKNQNVKAEDTLRVTKAPEVYVRLPNGSKLPLYVDPSDPGSRVMDLIASNTGIPIALQNLLHQGKPVSPTSSLQDQGIKPKTMLTLEKIPVIRVKTPKGPEIAIDADPQSTVRALKPLIATKSGIGSEVQELKYNSNELNDDLSLPAQKIPLGSVVHLSIKSGIHLSLPEGKVVSLPVVPTDKISDAKRLLAKVEPSLQPDELEFSYKGRTLKDSVSFADQDVPFGATIECQQKPTLTVQLPDGLPLPIYLPITAPLSEVKSKVEQRTSIPPLLQQLLYNGKILSNDKMTIAGAKIPFGGYVILRRLPTVVLKFPDGTTVPLDRIEPSDSIQVLEAFAASHLSLSKDDISLLFDGKPLDTGLTLQAEGVPIGAEVVVAATNRGLQGMMFAPPDVSSADGGYLLSTEQMNCIKLNGPYECIEDGKLAALYAEFEWRRHIVMIAITCLLFVLTMIVQSIIRLTTFKVAASKDRFVREVLETTFRTITIVTIVISIIEIVLKFNLFEVVIDKKLFHRFYSAFSHLTSTNLIVGGTFDEILQRIIFFLAGLLMVVIFLAFTAWEFSAWLDKVNQKEMRDIIVTEGPKKVSKEAQNFVALRFEFADSVGVMAVPGLDPEFFNFKEYFRACILKRCVQLIQLQNTMLLIGFFVVIGLIPLSHLRGMKMLLVLFGFILVSILTIVGILVRVLQIKKQLLPPDVNIYNTLRYRSHQMDAPIDSEELLTIGPKYKQRMIARKTVCSNCWIKYVYQTKYPNNHESLFFFWRGGPNVIYRLLEASIFSLLCVAAQSFYLINDQWDTWAKTYGPWPLLFFFLSLVGFAALIPTTLWNSTLVTNTGDIIDDGILQEVWEFERGKTVRRIAQLIDALRIQATLYEIGAAGESFYAQLQAKAQDVTPEVRTQNEQLFNLLDNHHDGQLNLPQLFKFLTQQGLNITSEPETQKWFDIFDFDGSGGIDKKEFYVIVSICKQLVNESLDVDSVKDLLIKHFNMNETAADAMGIKTTKEITDQLHIRWTNGQIIHLLEYMSGIRGTRSMSLEEFVRGLKGLEKSTLGTLTQAVGDLKSRKGLSQA